ncbi:MAG: hypothetical protein P1U39_08255 [Legionellaceae bacterium]|nr:hypothetical protein [Legionellaceae bacterium]
MNNPSNQSTRALKHVLKMPYLQSTETQTEPYEAAELEAYDTTTLGSSLQALSVKLNRTPTSSYASIRAVFYELRDIFKQIRQSKAFASNHEHLKTCLQLGYTCSIQLLKEQPIPHQSRVCTLSTKAMFDYYLSSCEAERHILALHLKFTDAMHHVEHDLASLLTEQDDERVHHQASQTHLTQKRAARVQPPVSLSSLQELETRWNTLSSKQLNEQNITKLFRLTTDVSQYVYHHKKHLPPAETNHSLTLGLAIEARYIEALHQSHGPIRYLSKSMQRAAQYFHALAAHYQEEGMPDLAAKMTEKQQLMTERALDYARMLACRHVEQSKNTSTAEKKHAKHRRQALQAELPERLDELCTQFQNVYDEASVQDPNVFFELYLEAHTYLEHIQYDVLAEIGYDKPLLNYDLNLHNEQNTLPEAVQAKLIALLKTEAGTRLQSAVQFYYDIKCKYYESIQKTHHQDASVEAERFQAVFQKQAYDLLLSHATHPQQHENSDLFKRNCQDILNARHYSTPLIYFMAQHHLDTISAHTVEEEKASPQPDITPTPALHPKTTKPAPKAISAPTDQTIWEHICSEYAVRSVNFAAYLEKIALDQGLNDIIANELYAAITDSNQYLLIDEHNIDAFYALYNLLVTEYFKPQETKVLEKLTKEQALAGHLEAVIPDDKLMVQSITILRGILNYSDYLKLEQKAELFFALGNIYVQLQSFSPKRMFKDEGTACFKRLQRLIEALDASSEARWNTFNLEHALKKLTPTSSFDARIVIANQLSDEEKQQQTSAIMDIQAQTRSLESRYEAIVDSAHHHTFISEIYWMLSIALSENRDTVTKTHALIHQLQTPVNATNLHFFTHLHAMLALCQAWVTDNVEASDHPTYRLMLKQSYDYLLTAYAKVNNIAEEQHDQVNFRLRSKIDDALPGAQACINNLLNLIRARINALEGHNPTQAKIDVRTLEKPLIHPLEIPEAFRTYDILKSALTMIEDKKYWQMLMLLKSHPFSNPQVLFIQARLHAWLLNMILTDDFQTLLGDREAVQTSYAFAKKHLEQQRLMFLNKASKNPWKALCKQERKNTPTASETTTPFRTLSLFSTQPKDIDKEHTNTTAQLGGS